MRILVTTVGLPGHFFPLVPLAWACRSAGHEVLVAASVDFLSIAVRSGLPVTGCGPAADFVDLGGADAMSSGTVRRRRAHGRAFGRVAAGKLAGTASLIRSWRPDLVLSERAEFAGPVAARESGVPLAELHWGVARLDAYRTEAADVLGLDALPEADLALNPWPPGLRPSYAAGHHSVRHVPYNGDSIVPEWVFEPRPRPRVCLTLGTLLPRLGAGGVTATVLPLLAELARLDVEIVVAIDDAVAAGWPELPAAVRHAGRMPLAEVLSACDVLVHHGGQGTSLTALAAGCPQLVLPHFDDQLDNADAVVASGAGLRLDELTPRVVAKSCLRLLDSVRFGRAAAGVAAEIAAQPHPADVVGALEELAA